MIGKSCCFYVAMDTKLPQWKPYLEPGKHQFTNGAN